MEQPVTNKPINTAPNATVQVKALETIKGDPLLYVVIDTLKGRVSVSIGEKNYKALVEILSK